VRAARRGCVVLGAFSFGCGGPGRATPEAAGCPSRDAVWASSDYSSSAVGAFALSGAVSTGAATVDLGADPVLAVSRGRAFYVARDLGTIFELDAPCGRPTSRWTLPRDARGGSPNPYDVAVASDGSVWVPLYDAAAVAVLTPQGQVATRIDLSTFDPDGNPDASAISIVDTPAGEKAFVALERLDEPNGFSADRDSWMLRIDVPTRAVETHVVLAGRNPFQMIAGGGGVLWLADPGNFDAADEAFGGVERFDTATSTSTLVVTEAALGGSVDEVGVSGGCAVAIVADATANVNATSLVTFDAATGAPIAPASASPLSTPGFDLEGLAWFGGEVAVGDRRRAASGFPVHAFDVDSGCRATARPDAVFLPLPPVDLRAIPR